MGGVSDSLLFSCDGVLDTEEWEEVKEEHEEDEEEGEDEDGESIKMEFVGRE